MEKKPLTFVDDHLLQLPLGGGPLQDLLVDGVGRDQAVHNHWLGLPDTVTAVLSLQVRLGVLRREGTINTCDHWGCDDTLSSRDKILIFLPMAKYDLENGLLYD